MTKAKVRHGKAYQEDVINYHITNPTGNIICVKSPRQVGKSACIAVLLIYASVSGKASNCICISPIYKQAKKLFKDVQTKGIKIVKEVNATDLVITFTNGSTVQFFSAESGQNLRGFTCKGEYSCLVIDEAAYIDKDLFYEVLMPFCNVYRSNILMFSTPRFKQGLFFEMFQKGLLGTPGVVTFDWCKHPQIKELLPDELLEQYRQQMPKRAFTSEYLGEFIDGDSVIFGNTQACTGIFTPTPPDELTMTIDWGGGTGNDDTAITIGQLREGKVCVERIITFNDKSTNQTIDTILLLLKDYVGRGFKSITVIVESNSIGNVYHSALTDKVSEWEDIYNDAVGWRDEIDITVRTFTTTNSSKKRIIEELSALFENGRILIPDDRKLISELSTYECKVSDKGVATYNAASGFHDDMVMSLAFLADYNWQYI